MAKEGLVQFKWCSCSWELRKAGGRSSYGELLRRPDSLRGCRGQEGGPVVPFGLFDCFEVGGERGRGLFFFFFFFFLL